MTAICLPNGKTWSITSGVRESGDRYRLRAPITAAPRFLFLRLCHPYLCIRFCLPLAIFLFIFSAIFHLNAGDTFERIAKNLL